MKKIFILFYCLAILFCISSCGRDESDSNNEVEISNNNFSLTSSKTQVAVETILQFSLQGQLPESITNINWDFGDGTTYYGNSSVYNVKHAFQSSGNYIVKAKLLYGNGMSVEKTLSINVVATNQVKLTKISISRVPQTVKQFSVLQYGNWVYYSFNGEWDQRENSGTSSIDRFADIYVEMYKTSDIVNPNDPTDLISNFKKLAYKSNIHINQQSLVYDLSSANIILNLESLKTLTVTFKDSDSAYSLNENGSADEEIRSNDIKPISFQTNSNVINIDSNGLIYSMEYIKL